MSRALLQSITGYIEADDVEKLRKQGEMTSWINLCLPTTMYLFGSKHEFPTVMQYAAYRGAAKCIKYILYHHPEVLNLPFEDVDTKRTTILPDQAYPYPLLHLAVISGSLETVAAILEVSKRSSVFDINQTDGFGFTALHMIVLTNKPVFQEEAHYHYEQDIPEMPDHPIDVRVRIANFLIANKADICKGNCLNDSPLVLALMRNVPLFSHFVAELMIKNREVLKRIFEEKSRAYGGPGQEERTLFECIKATYKPSDPTYNALTALQRELG